MNPEQSIPFGSHPVPRHCPLDERVSLLLLATLEVSLGSKKVMQREVGETLPQGEGGQVQKESLGLHSVAPALRNQPTPHQVVDAVRSSASPRGTYNLAVCWGRCVARASGPQKREL